jgi:hypothetical protein
MSDAETRDALRRMVREVLQELLPQEPGDDVRRVRVRDDRDLADVVTQVLNLAEDPVQLADLKAGRIRFALVTDDSARTPAGPGPIDVDRGAVTERLIQQAAQEQRPLRIGPRAVITPLARDRARALGVTIQRRETR